MTDVLSQNYDPPTKLTHTLLQCKINVHVASHQRQYDVVLTLCAHWVSTQIKEATMPLTNESSIKMAMTLIWLGHCPAFANFQPACSTGQPSS